MSTEYIGYKISDGSGHYINGNANADVSVGNVNNATCWKVDSNNYIYMTVSGTDYYMYPNDRTWKICTTLTPSSTQQKLQYHKEDRKIMYDNGGTNNNLWHINYSDGWIESNDSFDLTWTEVFLTCEDVTANQSINMSSSTSTNTTRYESEGLQSLTLGAMNRFASLIQYSTNVSTSQYAQTMYEQAYGSFTGNGSYPTYAPLTVKGGTGSDKYYATNANTGYMLAGGYSSPSDSGQGDARVAGYKISTYIGTDSYNSSGTSTSYEGTTATGRFQNIYTYVISGSTTQRVPITRNKTSGKLTSASYTQGGKTYNYSKYVKAESQLAATMSGDTYAYGLHFMKSSISMNRLVTTNNTILSFLGEQPRNYQMPNDCIDFGIQKRGFINFFAATYYKGNESFFSLNIIERNSTNKTKIDSIKEILEVYAKTTTNNNVVTIDESVPYVYKLRDIKTEVESYSDGHTSIPTGYTKVFDAKTITNPDTSNLYISGNTPKGYLFYFEIPVNAGEFALGSASSDGAYLLYLDVSANAQEVHRTSITQQTTVTTYLYSYPSGIEIQKTKNTTITPSNSATLTITNANKGKIINLTRNEDDIIVSAIDPSSNQSTTLSDLESTYMNIHIPLKYNSSQVSLNEDDHTDWYYKQLVYLDYNLTNAETTAIILTNSGGETSVRKMRLNNSNQLEVPTNDSPLADDKIYYNENGTGKSYATNDAFITDKGNFTTSVSSEIVNYNLYVNKEATYNYDVLIGATRDSTITDKTHYLLTSDNITISFTNVTYGETTDLIVYAKNNNYTVTINNVTIALDDYTYTFSTNTIATN